MSFAPSDLKNPYGDDIVAVCEFCDDVIDQADVNVEAFERAAGPCCVECAADLYQWEA